MINGKTEKGNNGATNATNNGAGTKAGLEEHHGNGNGDGAGRTAVVVDADSVILTNFRETDPTVVGIVAEAEDAVATLHDLLGTGARLTRLAGTSRETEIVKTAFDGFTAQVERHGAQLFDETKRTMAQFLDSDDGVLARTLASGREEFERLLDDSFDPNSKASVLGKIDAVIVTALSGVLEQLTTLIDPSDEQSVFGRHQAELLKGVGQQIKPVREMIVTLAEKIAVREAEAALMEKTAIKGGSFNDAVHIAVSELAAPHGDLAEMTNDLIGFAANKAGDEVVELNTADTGGVPARFVFENKTGKLGMTKTIKELEAAMANRGALVGVAVFGRAEHSPVGVPFHHNGNKAFVVLDRDELDARLLELAYCWARMSVRQQLVPDARPLDTERASELIEKVSAALANATTIKGCLTQAKNKLTSAGEHVDQMVIEADAALRELRELIDDTDGSEE